MADIAILGATGSIGSQALDLIKQYPEKFKVTALTAFGSAKKLFELVRIFRPKAAGLVTEPAELPEDVRFCEWYFGKDCSSDVLRAVRPEMTLCAITGIAGLSAVLTAIDVSGRVLLANKEALVTGGNMVMQRAKVLGKAILPVDSEHSAIFQCLQAANGNPVRSLILTASGGALRDKTQEEIENASVEDVLRHPTWNMGAKITVDCASMVNKGLEIIEAHYLFDMPLDRIRVLVHPQSIIHSMIEFEDNAVLAQLGCPDMRQPIGYAMNWPRRLPYTGKQLDLSQIATLTFRSPDTKRFPALSYAVDALRCGGSAPVVFNGANEAAVEAFLKKQIRFGNISRIINETMQALPVTKIESFEDVYEADQRARIFAAGILRRLTC